MNFFQDYPILASLVILSGSLFVGAIELEMVSVKPAAYFTWLIGGVAFLAPIGASSYNAVFKAVLIVAFLAIYAFCIRFLLKKDALTA